MKPHLTDGEIWVLRYIECASEPGGSCAQIRKNDWLPDGLPPSLQEAKERPRTVEEALKHAHALEDYGIVEALSWDTGGVDLRILGAGREWLWEHEHPNYFAAIWEWACGTKITACIVALYFIIGATGGIISLASNIKSLFGN